MVFGQQQQQQTQADASGDRWEARTISVAEGQEKQTSGGKVYWRIKDTAGKWYSVWEPSVKARLEIAAEKGETVPVAVRIQPEKNGGAPFYSIAGTDGAVETMVKEGASKAAASVAPGGRNSAFNRRMHPDDALRVTLLATIDRALTMVGMTLADKPADVKYETYVKAKVMEYNSFLSDIVNQPRTITPDAETAPNTPPNQDFVVGTETERDADIPF